MKWLASDKDEQNRAAFDPWTIVHFGSGLALGLMNAPLKWAMGASVLYEVIEQAAERSDTGQDLFETSGPETLSNAIVDVGVFYLGYRLGRRWNRT